MDLNFHDVDLNNRGSKESGAGSDGEGEVELTEHDTELAADIEPIPTEVTKPCHDTFDVNLT